MKTNTLTELKSITFDAKTYIVFHKYSPGSKKLKLTLNGNENKIVLTSPIENFLIENWNNFQLDNLLFRLLNKHKVKNSKLNSSNDYKQIYLSYSPDNHKITIYDKLVDLEWKYHFHSNYSFNFDENNSKLQIFCNASLKDDEIKRKNLFIYVLSRILEEFIRNKQLEFVKIMNQSGFALSNPPFKINLKKRAWGTNIKKGKRLSKITYDVKMIALPIRLIEAIILHKLVHEFHPNHSDKFYECGSFIMPDFKARNKEIRQIIVYLDNFQ
ncbi:YgjP-like metallopeptidase domain-containing protein [Mycoplasmopsis bovis]|uniref:YgjP-like metallopeptidase domain-containing protein n=1 Tax=Mycoplasmopsis bovis TaxID=28903 RepID=UPI001BDEDB1B|nr:YgjP-like metallopeptidase domain-containing protein [Mycoplasmopsis bovis]MBT1337531.1 M48 family metallopeptidase [Mycoplasmopsis bovis]UJB27549.1 M48 family metallopeptidase [Mycoplasmopsis bovis]